MLPDRFAIARVDAFNLAAIAQKINPPIIHRGSWYVSACVQSSPQPFSAWLVGSPRFNSYSVKPWLAMVRAPGGHDRGARHHHRRGNGGPMFFPSRVEIAANPNLFSARQFIQSEVFGAPNQQRRFSLILQNEWRGIGMIIFFRRLKLPRYFPCEFAGRFVECGNP